jgi:hypothetical protein
MAIIKDQRVSNDEREIEQRFSWKDDIDNEGVASYVLGTDPSMGEWGREIGKFLGRSLLAIPCRDEGQARNALARMRAPDSGIMIGSISALDITKRIWSGLVLNGDHLSIAPWDSPWVKPREEEVA